MANSHVSTRGAANAYVRLGFSPDEKKLRLGALAAFTAFTFHVLASCSEFIYVEQARFLAAVG